MKGQVGTGPVEIGQVQTSQFRTIPDGIGLVKTVQVRTGLVRTGQVSIICQPVTGQVWTSQVGDWSIQVWTDQVQSR